jgi:hypothetical protein
MSEFLIATASARSDYATWEDVLADWYAGEYFAPSYGIEFSVKDVLRLHRQGIRQIHFWRRNGTALGHIDITNLGDIKYVKAKEKP